MCKMLFKNNLMQQAEQLVKKYVSVDLGYSNREVKIDLFCGIVVVSLPVNDEGIL